MLTAILVSFAEEIDAAIIASPYFLASRKLAIVFGLIGAIYILIQTLRGKDF